MKRLTTPYNHPAFSFISQKHLQTEFHEATQLLHNEPEGTKIKLGANHDFKHEYLKSTVK